MTKDEFASHVLNKVSPEHQFQPTVTYDADGDCIEFIATQDNFYAVRIDSLITVYRSQENDEIMGSLIKGVSKFLRRVLQKAPGFEIEIKDGRIKLTHLFTARLWTEAEEIEGVLAGTYETLREVAEKSDAEVEVGDLTAA